jgi:hypothetical protein
MRNAGDLRYPKPLFYELELGLINSENCFFKQQHLDHDKRYWVTKQIPIENRDEIYPLVYKDYWALDGRYFIPEGDPKFWLSPRESLQLYCELINKLYANTWIRHGIDMHIRLMQKTIDQPMRDDPRCDKVMLLNQYDRMRGIFERPYIINSDKGIVISCFSDFRHKHEIQFAKEVAGTQYEPIIVRIKRPSIPTPPYDHRSETEQATIPDSEFDCVVNNDGSVEDLHRKADQLVNIIASNNVMKVSINI